MTYELILALMAFAFVTSITPGPNNLMLMASGINFGLNRSIPHILGVGLGFVLMILLVGLGLAEVFEAFPLSYNILRTLSVTYLGYLAWKIATTSTAPKNDTRHASASKPISFTQAALFQWVNPKAWIMTVSAISTYSPESGGLYNVIIIALIFGIIMLPSVSLWTILGTQIQKFLNSQMKRRAFNITAALLLIASLIPMIFGT